MMEICSLMNTGFKAPRKKLSLRTKYGPTPHTPPSPPHVLPPAQPANMYPGMKCLYVRL